MDRRDASSVCMFLYNVKAGVSCELDPSENATTLKTLNALTNANAHINGYLVDAFLYQLSRIPLNIDLADFGITMLMMFFAKFYSAGQYPIFVHTFMHCKELELIEKFILSYTMKSVKLPWNMATHDVYGIKRQQHRFTKTKCLTKETYTYLEMFMRMPNVKPEDFIACIEHLHISIIESFYIFTSITKDCKVVRECHDIQYSNLPYTFQKPIKSLTYDGIYWFTIPSKSIWFAYHQGKIAYSAYQSLDCNKLFDAFKAYNINCIIVGFIHNNSLYPIIFQDPRMIGDWDMTVYQIQMYKFNCIFQKDCNPPDGLKNVYFVKNCIGSIYKLVDKL